MTDDNRESRERLVSKVSLPEENRDVAELQEYFKLFCDILPLGNWRVAMQMANSHDMSHYVETPDAYGACNKNRNMMYAEVYINQEKPRVDSYGETWEVTLLHELFHVVLDDFVEYVEMKYPESYEDAFFQTKLERLINLLSYAFYDALNTRIVIEDDESEDNENTENIEITKDNDIIETIDPVNTKVTGPKEKRDKSNYLTTPNKTSIKPAEVNKKSLRSRN